MAIPNPFSITFGDMQVGGSSAYQLFGAYTIERTYDSFRLGCTVVLTADDLATMQQQSDTLETTFRTRPVAGDTISIDLGGNAWDFTVGQDILHVTSTVTKTADEEASKGLSRAYALEIRGELPADNETDAGLRDIEAIVNYQPTRQRTVTLRGTYTATTAGNAVERYNDKGDNDAQKYLDAVDNAATWELVEESYTMDRELSGDAPATHVLTFTRQYLELLKNQSSGSLDDTSIVDHRMKFTDLGQFPGDSREDAYRLRRVVGTFDCGIDITETTDLHAVYTSKIKDYIRQEFASAFNPAQYGVEEQRASFDETAKRISVSITFVYQQGGGLPILQVNQSLAYREERNIDYTPTHDENEFSFFADIGFAVLERIWTRSVVALGEQAPQQRIQNRAKTEGPVGRFDDVMFGKIAPDAEDTTKVDAESGWNVVRSMSQATPQWIGDPDDPNRIRVTQLEEVVVERYHNKPGARTSVPTTNPITGGR